MRTRNKWHDRVKQSSRFANYIFDLSILICHEKEFTVQLCGFTNSLTCTKSRPPPSAYSDRGRETGNFMRQLKEPRWPVCNRRCVSVDWYASPPRLHLMYRSLIPSKGSPQGTSAALQTTTRICKENKVLGIGCYSILWLGFAEKTCVAKQQNTNAFAAIVASIHNLKINFTSHSSAGGGVMFLAGHFLASEALRMSNHMVSEPCGATEDLGFHSARRSSGARGSNIATCC